MPAKNSMARHADDPWSCRKFASCCFSTTSRPLSRCQKSTFKWRSALSRPSLSNYEVMACRYNRQSTPGVRRPACKALVGRPLFLPVDARPSMPIEKTNQHRQPSLYRHFGRVVILFTAVTPAVVSVQSSVSFAERSHSEVLSTSDDTWRRTATGWVQLNLTGPSSSGFRPSHHASLAQSWPAAWAACMLLSIVGLASVENRNQPRPGRKGARSMSLRPVVMRSAKTTAVPHDR